MLLGNLSGMYIELCQHISVGVKWLFQFNCFKLIERINNEQTLIDLNQRSIREIYATVA